MKKIVIAFSCILSTMAIVQAEECSFEHVQMLNRAEGPKSAKVRELLAQETPNFSCDVTETFFAFPADCGRFTYAKYDFDVRVGGTTIKAVVHNGQIACVGMKKTELVKATFSK